MATTVEAILNAELIHLGEIQGKALEGKHDETKEFMDLYEDLEKIISEKEKPPHNSGEIKAPF